MESKISYFYVKSIFISSKLEMFTIKSFIMLLKLKILLRGDDVSQRKSIAAKATTALIGACHTIKFIALFTVQVVFYVNLGENNYL